MKIAVLSGKGGAGKTFVSVNLAVSADHAAYIDCDVEEPNGRLFLKPKDLKEETVSTKLPVFDTEKCTGCRKCVDFCRFNAIFFAKKKPIVFSEVCHSCGGCMMVCPVGAITEEEKPVGILEEGHSGSTRVLTGVLNFGEASGVPVINAALEKAKSYDELTVIDCPPGSACSVMESVTDADYCILVAEPTAFGFHNFQMVYELVTLLKKPCGVIINKMDTQYKPLEDFCKQQGIDILLRIPYSKKLADITSNGRIAVNEDAEIKAQFKEVLEKIGGAVR